MVYLDMHMTHLSNTKYFLLPAMVLMSAAPQLAFAQSSDPLSALYACEALAANDAQLACFRAETAKLRGAKPSTDNLGVRSTVKPVVNSDNSLAVEKTAEDSRIDDSQKFIPLKKNVELKTRKLNIKSTTTHGANRYIRFILENGEVWQQGETARLRLGKGDPDVLTIKKVKFGGTRGRVNDKSPSFRLKRIR